MSSQGIILSGLDGDRTWHLADYQTDHARGDRDQRHHDHQFDEREALLDFLH